MAWVWWGLAAAAGAAGVTILGRLGMPRADTVIATSLRSVVMTVALVGLAGASGRWRGLLDASRTMGSRAWLCLIGAGLCGAGSWLAYFAALKVGQAGPVAALDRLSLPLVFVLGVLFLGETPGWRGWLGLALAVGGISLIAWDQLSRVRV